MWETEEAPHHAAPSGQSLPSASGHASGVDTEDRLGRGVGGDEGWVIAPSPKAHCGQEQGVVQCFLEYCQFIDDPINLVDRVL